MIKLIGIGVGGSSKVIYDIIKQYDKEYTIVGWFDDDQNKIKTSHLGIQVLDTIDNIDLYKNEFDKAFICVGATKDTKNRDIIYNKLKDKNVPIHTIISKTAIISTDVIINEGCIILNGVIINSSVILEKNIFLNTGCIIEHDCIIKSSSFISPGVVLCGNVKIEENVFVGANATVIGNTLIKANSIIGAGSVVISNVESNSIIVGNPGKNIKK